MSKIALYAAGVLLWPLSAQLAEPRWPEPSNVHRIRGVSSGAATLMGADSQPAKTSRSFAVLDATDVTIRKTPICVLWTKSWAGNLGHTVLYRRQHLDAHRLLIGYFVYWTTERAWGENNLTRWFFPALAIDGIYSHLLFILPGLQRAMYGPGDIEGVRITFKLGVDGHVTPEALVADNEQHEEVRLTLDDAVDELGRIFVHNDVWSHQLGGRDALKKARSGAAYRCFSGGALIPLTDELANEFRLGSTKDPRRAGPAWRDTP